MEFSRSRAFSKSCGRSEGEKIHKNHTLVGGAITILKNMKVNGKDYPIYDGK
jgi:hypothetical protein